MNDYIQFKAPVVKVAPSKAVSSTHHCCWIMETILQSIVINLFFTDSTHGFNSDYHHVLVGKAILPLPSDITGSFM